MAEDAASVLEQFVQDGTPKASHQIPHPKMQTVNPVNLVANLPAEIAHLLEEIQAKDRTIQECRNTVHSRDSSIQKFIKVNGHGQVNPKEEAYAKNILASFDRAQTIQEEKVSLSEKAANLVRLPNATRTL